ncbi:unnamed protein product [Adineta ricciae]|uniref:ubiquitinyl hydrolase 1 n=1 Tax=Adineta ricciae TaxID=249248 RepID=A0A814GTN9_ADIRI|nr:unnamed protein product [Adineta ricciae]CAF1464349.1 unnamed protein product [Adineta ricciae]
MQQYSSSYHNNDRNEDIFNHNHHTNANEHRSNTSEDVKLRRSNVDHDTNPILHRALSTVSANQTLVDNQRNALANNYRRTSINDEIVTIDHNDAEASFILPNLYELPEDIRVRVMDSLVDTPTMVSLEETKRLNWWVNKKLPCPKLYPLVTTGDGNCLLHATSLAMWGFHDHSLSMRKALNETLITSKPNSSLYRRWRWAQSVQNKKYGLVFSEQEWSEEWKSLLRLSSAEPRTSQTKSSDCNPSNDELDLSKSTENNNGSAIKPLSQSPRQYYESLEEFHVYVLANNIRRPIVIYSDTILRTNDGEAISPIEFGGIYLPLEIPPDKCHKQPVFLAFDAAHFSALVPMEQSVKSMSKITYRIPLIDIETLDLLPIHFLIDPGLNFQWPIDEELSDDKIHLYPNYEESRMDVLEKYLYLSKEYSSMSNPTSQASTTTIMSTHENLPATEENVDSSNEVTPTPTIPNKKLSRSSFNSFSKIIRRTFIHPFSSAKRASVKNHQSQTSTSSIISENINERRKSSPLFNRHTQILTIIVTNFQPKQPKACDNMIKNYIDACMNEYNLEKNQKQLDNENDYDLVSKSNNHHSNWTDSSLSNSPLVVYHRHYPSSSSINRYQHNVAPTNVNEKLFETGIKHKLPQIPSNSSNRSVVLTRIVQKNSDIDDSEDSLPIENGQFSTNINYVQRKSNPPFTRNKTHELISNLSHYPESQINDVSNKALPSQKLISSSLKRQQSSSSDKNSTNLNLIDYTLSPSPTTTSTTVTNINKRTQQLNTSSNLVHHKRL